MTPAELTKQVPFGKIEGQIVALLVRRFGTWVATDDLCAAAYAHDPDGGPAGAANAVKVHVHYIRKKLKPFGYAIEGHWGAGRRLVSQPTPPQSS